MARRLWTAVPSLVCRVVENCAGWVLRRLNRLRASRAEGRLRAVVCRVNEELARTRQEAQEELAAAAKRAQSAEAALEAVEDEKEFLAAVIERMRSIYDADIATENLRQAKGEWEQESRPSARGRGRVPPTV